MKAVETYYVVHRTSPYGNSETIIAVHRLEDGTLITQNGSHPEFEVVREEEFQKMIARGMSKAPFFLDEKSTNL